MRLRILGVSVLVIVVILAGAWVSAMPAAASTWTPFPSDTPFAVNGTSAVIQGTADAYGTASAVAPFPTYANVRATAYPMDPIYTTATYIIERATQTAAFYMTATAHPIDPLYITATAIVAGPTQTEAYYMTVTAGGPTASGLSETPISTLSVEEQEDFRLQWYQDLEQATGFSHPVFDYITYSYLIKDFGGLEVYKTTDTGLHLEVSVRRMTVKNVEYVAVIVQDWMSLWDNKFWMFRLIDNAPELIIMPDSEKGLWGALSFAPASSEHDGGFGDWNGNGRPEVAIGGYGGGNCGPTWTVLWELQPDGEWISIMPPMASAYHTELEDLDNDGIYEVKAVWQASVPLSRGSCEYFPLTRIYKWDGTAYTDISPSLDDSYWPEIKAFWDAIKDVDGCLLPSYGMYQMLLGYTARRQLAEGWSRLAPLLQWDHCSPEVLNVSAKDMGDFLAWIGLEIEKEQNSQDYER